MDVCFNDEKRWINIMIAKSNMSGLHLNFIRRQSNISAPLMDVFPFVTQLAVNYNSLKFPVRSSRGQSELRRTEPRNSCTTWNCARRTCQIRWQWRSRP